MAIQRLRDIQRSGDPSRGDTSRNKNKHVLHYDLEAFIWVTFYSILIYISSLYRNEEESNKGSKSGDQEGADSSEQEASLNRQTNRQRVIARLTPPFKYFKLEEVKQAKESFVMGGWDVFELIEDENLQKVAEGTWALLQAQNLRYNSEAITHDKLCQVFKAAGAEISPSD